MDKDDKSYFEKLLANLEKNHQHKNGDSPNENRHLDDEASGINFDMPDHKNSDYANPF